MKQYKSVVWCIKFDKTRKPHAFYYEKADADYTARHIGGTARVVELFEEVSEDEDEDE